MKHVVSTLDLVFRGSVLGTFSDSTLAQWGHLIRKFTGTVVAQWPLNINSGFGLDSILPHFELKCLTNKLKTLHFYPFIVTLMLWNVRKTPVPVF